MLETDAPWMGFVKGRRESEPQDVTLVAKAMSQIKGLPLEEVCRITTENAIKFFSLKH